MDFGRDISGRAVAPGAAQQEEVAVIGVAELCRRLRFAVERGTGAEWIEGEVSGLKRAPSGHLYFSLKDERADAMVDCVMYKFAAQRFGRVLDEGARVQLRGRATVYEKRGRLQLVADQARPAGRGALLEALERLKQQLAAEGLFAAERKRAIPASPRVVGVVTSRSGAAIHDIRTVAFRRGNVHLLVSHALVQGVGSVESLLAALDRVEAVAALDVLIIGRGGGALEDLMAFNDERLVRRLAQCRVPVVSAVGHEVDTTLCDLVADVRAATPSQAAELVVPDARERQLVLDKERRQLGRALLHRVQRERLALESLRTKLTDPRFVIALRQQELDELESRLERSALRALGARRAQVELLRRRLGERHPRAVLAAARLRLGPLENRLIAALRRTLDERHRALGRRGASLQALSPLSILGRGYALATDEAGEAVRDAGALSVGQRLQVRVQRGAFAAEVCEVLSTVENATRIDHERPSGREATGETV